MAGGPADCFEAPVPGAAALSGGDPGRLVSKAEVRQHVWAGTHVSDTVLRVSVHEIREALGDVAAAPRYLATVGRESYRFLLGDDPEGPPPRTPGPML